MPAMSFIPAHFTTQFDAIWQHLCQYKIDKLREYVMVDNVRGKEKSYNQFGPLDYQPVTVRAGDTRITDGSGAKRWLRPYPFDLANLFDEWDEQFLGDVTLPKSDTTEAHGYGYGRLLDRTVINAALGTAYTGETGVTPVTLPGSQQIGVNFVESGSVANSGLTIGKLREAKYRLDDAEVDEEEPRVCACGAKQLQDLLRTTEVTSADYNTVRALVEGRVNSFLGFNFKRVSSSFLPYNATTDIRTVACWAKSGIKLSDSGRRVHIDIRVDKSHALQIRSVAAVGATRMEEIKVIAIDCDQSPA